MKSSARKIQLASYDDLFKNDEERLADTQERIQMLSPEKMQPFPNHPFKVVDDDKMMDMLRWVGKMNNIRACADEIVLNDIVYS